LPSKEVDIADGIALLSENAEGNTEETIVAEPNTDDATPLLETAVA